MKYLLFLSVITFSLLPMREEKIKQKFEDLHQQGSTVKRFFKQKWDKEERNCIQNIAQEYDVNADYFYHKTEAAKMEHLFYKNDRVTFHFFPDVPESVKQKIIEIGSSKKLPCTEVKVIHEDDILAASGYRSFPFSKGKGTYYFNAEQSLILDINPNFLAKFPKDVTDQTLLHEIEGHLKNYDGLKMAYLYALVKLKFKSESDQIKFSQSNSLKNLTKLQEKRADLNGALKNIQNARLVEKVAKLGVKQPDIYMKPQEFIRKAQKIRMLLEAEYERQFSMPNGKPNIVGLDIWYDTMWRKTMKKQEQKI